MLWILFACGNNTDESALPCGEELPEGQSFEQLETLGKAALDMINQDRAFFSEESNGAQDLVWNDELMRVGACHAAQMCSQGFFDHVSPDGGDLVTRLEEWGGYEFGPDYQTAGENLAAAAGAVPPPTSSDETLIAEITTPAHQGYMNECQCNAGCPSGKQAGHRMSILHPDFAEVGVAHWYCDADSTWYQVQVFWRQDGPVTPYDYCADDFTADPPSPSTSVE